VWGSYQTHPFQKARKHLNKMHARARNQRQDWLHKLTAGLVQKYDRLYSKLFWKGGSKT